MYEKPLSAINCCVSKQTSKQYWTKKFQIGDIICVDGLYFEKEQEKQDTSLIAAVISREDFEAYQYYYVVVGIGGNKLIVYSSVSSNFQICGGYIEEDYSDFVKSYTSYLTQKYPSQLIDHIRNSAIQIPTALYAKILNQNLINNPLAIYNL